MGHRVAGVCLSGLLLSLTPISAAWTQDNLSTLFAAGVPDANRLVFFEVAAQPINEALIAFALQGNISIGLQDANDTGIMTQRLSGLYSTGDGLRLLLNGTGLSYRFVDAGTVRVFRDTPVQRATAAPRPQARPQQRRTQRTPLPLEEILVTSTKRERDPQDLPMGISTVSGETLEAMQVRDTDDLLALVAGFSSTNQGPGRNKIFLRGQSDGPLADRTQSTVGIYIDESPLVFSDTNPDFRLTDVERIEVLRGPQGTLFGAGSMGGTFRIITNKPDPAETFARAGAGGAFTNSGSPTVTTDAVLNVPLSRNRAALRAAVFYDAYGGFIDDTRLDETNINDATIYGGRFSFLTDVTDGWSVLATVNAQTIQLDDTQYYSPDAGLLIRQNYVPEPRKDRFVQAGLTVTGGIGGADFSSTTTIVSRRITNQADASRAVPDLLGLSERASPFNARNKISTWAQEMRLTRTSRYWDWLIGGFYLDRNENLMSSYTVPGAALAFPGDVLPGDEVFAENRDDDIQQYAGFADVSFAVTPKLRMGLGVRLSRGVLDVSSLTTGLLRAQDEETDITNSATHVNPRVSLTYEWSPETNTYAQAARGFRVGGININTPLSALFDPELDPDETLKTQTFSTDTLWNYEIGVKSRLYDGRLTFNGAVFWVDWEDIQTDQILPTGFLFVTNAGNARNIGVEVQMAARMTDDLTVTATVIWNDPELRGANAFLNAERGDRLPAISELTLGLGLNYTRPLTARTDLTVTMDYAYVGGSRLFFDPDLSPEMGDYHRANLRVGLKWDDWQARLYVNNFLNDRGNTFAYGNSWSLNASSQFTPLRPRTFGFDVVREF